jgi:hypothetical protein
VITRVLFLSQTVAAVTGAFLVAFGQPLLSPAVAPTAGASGARPAPTPAGVEPAEQGRRLIRADPGKRLTPTASRTSVPTRHLSVPTSHLSPPRAVTRPAANRPARGKAHRPNGRPRPPHTAPRPASTAQQRMNGAVARIPGYRTGGATWILSDAYGSWGTADWYHDRIYISPRVPARRIYDVVAHEWSHLVSVRSYGGDVTTATQAMNRWFGGTGLTGAERAADCMAKRLGARWTNYTSCPDARWQQGAQRLLEGHSLPVQP